MKALLQITNNVYWMPFPKQEYILEISQYLNKEFRHQYYIWNLSEHDYERELFQNQVSMHSYIGFACPPLYELLLICKCILEWVQHDGNVAIVHCQQNKGRSAILLSLLWTFIFKTKIQESFYIISKALNLSSPLKCQIIYLKKYIKHLISNTELNDQQIRIKSIILSSVPKQFDSFQPYFQILDRNGVIYEEKQIVHKNEQCLFILPNFQINQDTVFRCRHITKDHDLIPIFRFQLHTSFLFKNIIRFTKDDLDLRVSFPDDFYIDLVYLRGNENQNMPDFQKTNHDQHIDGNLLIQKLLKSCEQLSSQIALTLFQENILDQQEYKEEAQKQILQQVQNQQQQQQKQQLVVQDQQKRKQSNQEQQIEKEQNKNVQQVEMTEMHAKEKEETVEIVEKKKSGSNLDENDEEDEIII